MRLGVCYYPEHWDEKWWAEDAARMADIGLSIVRIGEFAWHQIEPARDDFHWDWLDRAIDTLGAAGLEVMLGTPTATPPKWLIDAHPDILPYDAQGRPRMFGSRRHYCFSSRRYREETRRIVEKIAQRYGQHPVVSAWQTDNEYGCHRTIRSYSPEAARAFRMWLKERYGDIATLNQAWGNDFWSMNYNRFEAVDLPNLTVTVPNPSHVLDFYRFSSDQVVSYNRIHTDILRAHSPERDIYHNFMGFFWDVDPFAVGADIDVAGWDSYPLGFTTQEAYDPADKARYLRQGHPDFAPFHHDIYRACSGGRWAVLEQQPGPVNWAPYNPAPMDGMVRLWSHDAFAHGAELVSYFRWRQAPFAQEQDHAGLMRPDNQPAQAETEARHVAEDIKNLPVTATPPSPILPARIAVVMSFETQWMSEVMPQGENWDYYMLCHNWHMAARRFGHNVDIIPPEADLNAYDIVLVPSLFYVSAAALNCFQTTQAQIIFGPRCGSKTQNLHIPEGLAPGPLRALIPLTINRSESLPPSHTETAAYMDQTVHGHMLLDHVDTQCEALARTDTGHGVLFHHNNIRFFTTVPATSFLERVIETALNDTGLSTQKLPQDIRIRHTHTASYIFNFGTQSQALDDIGWAVPSALHDDAEAALPPAGVRIVPKTDI